MRSLSVVIIAFNEGKNIIRCIDSVREVADEIILLDSFSSDDTAELAKRHGAVVYQQEFTGYVSQKNAALKLAKHDLVLSMDADEALSLELVKSIQSAKLSHQCVAYKMNRRAFYCGRFINHGSWYPEPKVRMFDRREVVWGGLDPHDRIIVPRSINVCFLKGDIHHFIVDSVEQHVKRSHNFSRIAADSLFAAGRKSSWFKIIGSPTWFFLNDYILRGGFMDGWRGWRIAAIQTMYHYEKYKILRDLWREKL